MKVYWTQSDILQMELKLLPFNLDDIELIHDGFKNRATALDRVRSAAKRRPRTSSRAPVTLPAVVVLFPLRLPKRVHLRKEAITIRRILGLLAFRHKPRNRLRRCGFYGRLLKSRELAIFLKSLFI